MARDTLGSEFYWENIIVIQVEDKVFCVPRYEFVKSSIVFADTFLLPPGPAAHSNGWDREHAIFLEGYKKDEFVCLLKVMYPTAGSLISGTELDLPLEKEEWVSVLKLSTIWKMEKIRKYAIHRLSTEMSLSPTEKVRLGRAHKVAAWLEEGITSLVSGDPKYTFEDLATLGWETAARILWIQNNSNNILRFPKGDIKCSHCSSPSSLMVGNHNCHSCGLDMPADAELTFPGLGSGPGNTDRFVELDLIQCKCTGRAFGYASIRCRACPATLNRYSSVRITPSPKQAPKLDMIMEIFGEDMEDYRHYMAVA